jgi:hypothetical protein
MQAHYHVPTALGNSQKIDSADFILSLPLPQRQTVSATALAAQSPAFFLFLTGTIAPRKPLSLRRNTLGSLLWGATLTMCIGIRLTGKDGFAVLLTIACGCSTDGNALS